MTYGSEHPKAWKTRLDKERGNFSLRGGGTGDSGLERTNKRDQKGEAALLGAGEEQGGSSWLL